MKIKEDEKAAMSGRMMVIILVVVGDWLDLLAIKLQMVRRTTLPHAHIPCKVRIKCQIKGLICLAKKIKV